MLLERNDMLYVARDSAVVCVILATPLSGPEDAVVAEMTINSLLAARDVATPTLLVGEEQLVRTLLDEREPSDASLVGLCVDPYSSATNVVNRAIRASAPADFVMITPGVVAGAGWLPQLRAVALCDSTVASVTPLSSSGTEGRELGIEACPKVAYIGHRCAYIRRSALELYGPLDDSRSLADALDDAAMSLVAHGMVHLTVGGTALSNLTSTSNRTKSSRIQQIVERTLEPSWREATNMRPSPDRPSRISVTIDGRSLTSAVGGTQTYTLGLALALARQPAIDARVLIPPDLSSLAADALTKAEIDLITHDDVLRGISRTDVAHRPQQVFTPDDLMLLRALGEHVVVTHQDLIAYHNFSYHPDLDAWRTYRLTTSLALNAVDEIVFLSEHARRDALAEGLVSEGNTHVVGIGLDHLDWGDSAATPPRCLTVDDEFLLCLGADYAHKNRPFAMKLVLELRRLGWPGCLVLAGPHVPFGSSLDEERALLKDHPSLGSCVVPLGAIDEPTKRWLCEHARALLYPTVYEGFGLLPLEAARLKTPCLFAAQASLAEFASAAATLIPWNLEESAKAVLPLLLDGSVREEHISELTRMPIPSWPEISRDLVDVYRQARYRPRSTASLWQETAHANAIAMERDRDHHLELAQEYQDAYHALSERVSDGLPLIDGSLLSRAERRGLMRIASRRPLGSVLLTPLGWLGGLEARRARRSKR